TVRHVRPGYPPGRVASGARAASRSARQPGAPAGEAMDAAGPPEAARVLPGLGRQEPRGAMLRARPSRLAPASRPPTVLLPGLAVGPALFGRACSRIAQLERARDGALE